MGRHCEIHEISVLSGSLSVLSNEQLTKVIMFELHMYITNKIYGMNIIIIIIIITNKIYGMNIIIIIIIIIIITSNDDLQPSIVITNLSPSGLV